MVGEEGEDDDGDDAEEEQEEEEEEEEAIFARGSMTFEGVQLVGSFSANPP